jgi:hypothetical protein
MNHRIYFKKMKKRLQFKGKRFSLYKDDKCMWHKDNNVVVR